MTNHTWWLECDDRIGVHLGRSFPLFCPFGLSFSWPRHKLPWNSGASMGASDFCFFQDSGYNFDCVLSELFNETKVFDSVNTPHWHSVFRNTYWSLSRFREFIFDEAESDRGGWSQKSDPRSRRNKSKDEVARAVKQSFFRKISTAQSYLKFYPQNFRGLRPRFLNQIIKKL